MTPDEDLAAYYAARAAEYDRVYLKPERQDDLRQIEDWLPGRFDGKHVLELACGTGWWTRLIAPRAASVLAVVLLTLFFMIYGQSLQRAAIALFPNRQQQRFTTDILRSIEHEVSRYVLTISVINTVVGLLLAGVLMLLGIGLQEALLWGTVAALLNFAPYVGPLLGVALMLLMGFVEFRDPLQALLPAAAYLALHTLEGQLVTPIVLGRQMKLSPLVLILALMVFGWAWGMIGLLLAVPLLVCIKLVLARLDGMHGWARLLE